MKQWPEQFFIAWAMLSDNTWMGVFNLIIIPLFLCGLSKKIWASKIYRIITLAILFVFIVLSLIGFFYISRPPA